MCLALSPFEEKMTQDADEQITFMSLVLSIFEKSFDIVVSLKGDNCTPNQCVGTEFNSPRMVCGSHQFQSPARKIVEKTKILCKRFEN